MEVRALTRKVRVSPIKVRPVIDLIRNKDVSDALNTLENLNNKSARLIKKTLDSAIANAVNNHGLEEATLYVKEARVDEGTILKRAKPGKKGRYDKRYHRLSHILIIVENKG